VKVIGPPIGKFMNPEKNLQELGLTLPQPPAAAGAYVPAVRTGNLLYLAGTLPMRDGKIVYAGKVGQEINLVQAAEAAQLCTLNALANAKAALGSLDAVVRVVMVNGFVNGIDGFSDSPKVLNGASEFLLKVFGDAGKHARAAVSVNGLPLGAAVEVQIVLEVR
jgi:enamine deaminase RidA (YjgF/YER057c/UK114 family)